MKIIDFAFTDHYSGLSLEKTAFGDLSLLVGVSGVGKTQILNAIIRLNDIVWGHPVNGFEWEIHFLDINKKEIFWRGQFDVNKDQPHKDTVKNIEELYTNIIEETVIIDGKLIVERKLNETIFLNQQMPKFDPRESVVKILKQEEVIKPVYNSIFYILISGTRYIHLLHLTKPDLKYFANDELIKNNNGYLENKIIAAFITQSALFDKIANAFRNIFETVEDIRFQEFSRDNWNFLEFQLKEKTSDKWIPADKISSGMLRTFYHIAELTLLPDGSVILIDELENSLGVNCLDVVTNQILMETPRLQVIATSHHPYVINNIPFDNWKLVTRKGSVIQTHDALDLGFGRSKQKNYIQLINSMTYQNGLS